MRCFALLLALLTLASCASTGDPNHPLKFYGWRFYVFGHERYTPEEAVVQRCIYRNRLPDDSRSGFSRVCRELATRFPPGINAAMYATGCRIEMCHSAIASWPEDLE